MNITLFQTHVLRTAAGNPVVLGLPAPTYTREFLTLELGSDEGLSGLGMTFFGFALKPSVKSSVDKLAWLTFGGLLAGRWRFGWRGRQAANLIVAGTVFLVLAYIGSKFVLEVLLGR